MGPLLYIVNAVWTTKRVNEFKASNSTEWRKVNQNGDCCGCRAAVLCSSGALGLSSFPCPLSADLLYLLRGVGADGTFSTGLAPLERASCLKQVGGRWAARDNVILELCKVCCCC